MTTNSAINVVNAAAYIPYLGNKIIFNMMFSNAATTVETKKFFSFLFGIKIEYVKKQASIAKGIGVGMLVGGAMTIIGSSMMNSKKANYKKMAKKAIKSAESFMDSMM